MMASDPDFLGIMAGSASPSEAFSGVPVADLPRLTDEIYDAVTAIVGDASDAEVVFVPDDPNANDPPGVGWTIGHVVVHLTAGLEEAAALGSALARGAGITGRSRSETPWETVTTAAQVRDRLTESRRMTQAFLVTWPNHPDLTSTDTPVPRFGPLNAVARHLLGVMHAHGHLAQLRETRRQAGITAGATA